MPNKMLIDASHPEETRVVVTRGSRIEEFDFESQDKKQLKGNIYLARVTRVEPSLQAAFVEYGGNRHGFLAFSEIHPDYYQIPVADRQALLRAEAEAAESEDEDEADADERGDRGRGKRRRRGGRHRGRDERRAEGEAADAEATDEQTAGNHEASSGEAGQAADSERSAATETAETVEDASPSAEYHTGDHTGQNQSDEGRASAEETTQPADVDRAESMEVEVSQSVTSESSSENSAPDEASSDEPNGDRPASMAAAIDSDVIAGPIIERTDDDRGHGDENDKEENAAAESEVNTHVEEVHADESEVESVGAEDALEEVRNRRRPVRRNYKIQEVIKRRQILLVQVVKEERGNKGAALTTYLSLAGRYSVLMPNTARGGGISRKITNAQDRKRLKEVVSDLDVPQGMGVILRTAGESRTKAEIKRDYEYLMRLWETVRNLTLQSTAPALVYEEGSLIKRSVRDLYNKDIDEIQVSGEDGYREAKDFMRMLMPSHAKVVQPYRDTVPIFARAGIEAQLDRMLQPQVTLKSGGYIIINQTEALVAIDVNSGRSTREHSIEDTALQTNLEAAEEVARQLRLRDLAGLIVIDFIDMEENRNNRAVEKRLKDCLKNDRARIQVGRISHFGLLEMSRQRIRASVLESTMKPCPHCGGTGHVRSDSSVALHVVRAIEEFLLKDSRSHILVRTPTATALYVLNHKRGTLVEMERRFGVTISLEADETLGAQPYAIFRGAVAEKPVVPPDAAAALAPRYEEDEDEVDLAEENEGEPAERSAHGEGDGQAEHPERKRRRRRRRRGGRDHEHGAAQDDAAAPSNGDEPDSADEDDSEEASASAGGEARNDDGSHKKRRRGKRGGRRNRPQDGDAETAGETAASGEASNDEDAVEPVTDGEVAATEAVGEVETVSEGSIEIEATVADEPEPKPRRAPRRAKKAEAVEEEKAPLEVAAIPEPDVQAPEAEAEDSTAPTHWTRRRPSSEAEPAEPIVVSSATPDESKPKKAGWWQRKGFF